MGMHSTNHPPRQPHPRGAAIRPVPPFRSLQGVLLLHPPVLIHSRRVPPCVLCALLLASTRLGPRVLFFSHRSFLAGRAHLISSADRGFPGHIAHSHWAGRRILPQESPTTTSAACYYLEYNPNLPEVRPPPQSTLPRADTPRVPHPPTIMAATGTPRLSTYSTPATPANRGLSAAPAGSAQASQLLQQQQQAQAQAPPLPPPATFDVVPHLHALLNRLLIQKPTDAAQQQQAGEEGGKAAAGGGEEGSKSGGSGGGGTAGAASGAGAGAGASSSSADPDAQPLEIHQLAAASSALKVRLQKARQACVRLGDMDRTVDEQQEEIDELEERVSKLRAVLEDMGVGATTTAAAAAESRAVTVAGGDGGNEMVLRDARPI